MGMPMNTRLRPTSWLPKSAYLTDGEHGTNFPTIKKRSWRMAWLLIVAAALAEVGMAAALKASAGWSKLVPSVLGVALALSSIFLLTKALTALPTGPAYAAWTGLGAVGVVLLGSIVHGDTLSAASVGCIALIIVGVVGLHVL